MNAQSITFYVCALSIGTVSVLWMHRLKCRYRYDFLHILFGYQVAHSIYGFVFFSAQFLIASTSGLGPESRYHLYTIVGNVVAPAWSVFAYLLLLAASNLVGWVMPRKAKIGYWMFHGSMFALAFWGTVVLIPEGRYDVDLILTKYLTIGFVVSLLLGPTCLLVGGLRATTRSRRRLARELGVTFLACSGAMIATIYVHPPFQDTQRAVLLSQAAVFFVANVAPVLYISRSLKLRPLSADSQHQSGDAIARICNDCGLTRREREILPLIAVGLTNDEVASRLFIATKTVKNNVSSIYQKTGARNRVELANLVGSTADH